MHLLSPLLSLCLLILPLPPSSTLFPYTTLFRSSAMAAPAGLYLSKILLPETEVPVTRGDTGSTTESTHANVVDAAARSEEHTSELQSQSNLVCRLLLEKKKKKQTNKKTKK